MHANQVQGLRFRLNLSAGLGLRGDIKECAYLRAWCDGEGIHYIPTVHEVW